jgi:hypothetical protein
MVRYEISTTIILNASNRSHTKEKRIIFPDNKLMGNSFLKGK